MATGREPVSGRRVRARRATYPLVTGRDPATSAVELKQRLEREHGLDLAADLPQVSDALRSLVLAEMNPVVSERLRHTNAILEKLSDVERDLGTNTSAARGSLKGAIFHSDHGSVYCSRAYAKLCKRLGVTQSMGAVGSSADNALAESFNATMKREVLRDAACWSDDLTCRRQVFRWLVRYNIRRRHSWCRYLSPSTYESQLRCNPLRNHTPCPRSGVGAHVAVPPLAMVALSPTSTVKGDPWLDLTAFGATFRVPLGDYPAEERERLRRMWSRCTPELDAAVRLTSPPRFSETGDLANHLSRWLTDEAVEATSGTAVPVHAAGVAVDGLAVALVGPPGAGKSTMATGLGGRAGYLSDEAVGLVLGPSGVEVLPFAKPVSFVGPDHKYDVDPDELGLGPGAPRLPLGALLLLRRSPTPTDAKVSPVSWGEALETLATETLSLAAAARPVPTLLAAAGLRGPAALEYCDAAEQADEIVAALADYLAAPAFEAPVVTALASPPVVSAGPDQWAQRAFSDAGQVDTEVLLLIQDRLLHLAGLSAAVWRSVADPASSAQVAQRIDAEIDDVAKTLDKLADDGLVSPPSSP